MFILEVSDRSLMAWMFGNPTLTALSSAGCSALAQYDSLYSYSGDGSCYSVIFHSMIMRTLFDQGVLGLFVLYGFVIQLLIIRDLKCRAIITIVAVLGINGLSVSSMNSVYFSIALLILGSVISVSSKVVDEQ